MPKSPRQVRREIQDAVSEQVRDLPIHAVRLAMFGVGRALLLSDRVTRDYKEIRESGVRPVLDRLRDDARNASSELAGKVVGKVLDRNGSHANGSVRPLDRDETPVARPPARPTPVPNNEISVGKPTPAAKPSPASAPKPSPASKAEAAPVSKPSLASVPEPASASKPAPAPEPSIAAKPTSTPKASSTAKAASTPKPTASAKAASEPAAAVEPAAEAKSEPVVEPTPTPTPTANAKSKPVASAAVALPVPDYDSATLASVRARLRALTAAQVSKLREYEAAHEARPDFLKMFDNRLAKLANLS